MVGAAWKEKIDKKDGSARSDSLVPGGLSPTNPRTKRGFSFVADPHQRMSVVAAHFDNPRAETLGSPESPSNSAKPLDEADYKKIVDYNVFVRLKKKELRRLQGNTSSVLTVREASAI